MTILERKIRVGHSHAHGVQKRQILIDDVWRHFARSFRVKKARGPLAQQLCWKPDHTRGPRQPREYRGFHKTLQIERGIVSGTAKITNRR